MNFIVKTVSWIIVLLLLCGCNQPKNESSVITAHKKKMWDFISEMPKVELHIHLEGTMNPETVSKLANRNKFNFFNTTKAVEDSLASRKPGLAGFLQHHEKQVSVLQTEEDFFTVVYDFLKNCKENNIVYVEFFFDPQIHTARGIDFDDILKGILAGRDEAEKTFGVKAELIMSINREKSVASAFKMLQQAKPYKHKILGLGLDNGPEEGNPPSKFKEVYAEAKKQGYFLTAHNDVDEKDTVQHIWESINVLKLDRLDHSLNAMEDFELIDEINRRGLCLTGSPVQRTTDPEPQEISRIRFLFEHGVCVSLHSDDPGEFASGYLSKLLFNFQQAGKFTKRDMALLMLNAYEASWLPEQQKKTYIDKFKAWAEQNSVNIGVHYFNKHSSNFSKGYKMTQRYIEPTQEAGAELFSRNIEGEMMMLNMLRFRQVADYSENPELAPENSISGKEAYQKYMTHSAPFLKQSGGDLIFTGTAGKYLIGPDEQQWDLIMIVRQRSLADFMTFASNEEYRAGMGHRTAALEDSRLLPMIEFKTE